MDVTRQSRAAHLNSQNSHGCLFSPLPLGMTDVSGREVLTAVLSHPQVSGQPKNHQAKYREEDLLHYCGGNDGLLIPVDDCYLDDYPTDHDEAHGR